MQKYPLLVQRRISRRMSWKAALLTAILLALGLYDQFTGVLGPNWFWIWLAVPAAAIMWLYYGLLMRRAAVHIGPGHLRLQGPLYGRKVSFKRIKMVTPDNLGQHYPDKHLKRGERSLLQPLYHRTCAFIELNSFPRSFKWRRLWFPRTLFGANRKGLLCHVDDWMIFNQELESVRTRRQSRQEYLSGRRPMSLAGRILAQDVEFQ